MSRANFPLLLFNHSLSPPIGKPCLALGKLFPKTGKICHGTENAVHDFEPFVGCAGVGMVGAMSCGAGINPRKTKPKKTYDNSKQIRLD